MIKVLYGVQTELIDSYISDYCKKNKLSNIIKYDYNDIDINVVLEELSYLDLFGERKLIILYNSKFLTSEETLDNKNFEDFINNPNPVNDLFLVTNEETLDERKKIVKLLRKTTEIIEYNKFSEYDAYKFIRSLFETDGYKIDEKSIKEIYDRISSNISMLKNECNKLKLYKIDGKEITYNDVINITSKLPEDNVFKLVDAVINNNKELIFKLYGDIKLTGTDEIALIGLLASQFRFMYQVKVLNNEGKSKNEIVSILKSHPYKTELTLKKISSYKEDKLLDILYKLSLMDIDIKSGEMDKTFALENFFLNL